MKNLLKDPQIYPDLQPTDLWDLASLQEAGQQEVTPLAGDYHQIPAVFYCRWAGLEHGQELGEDEKALIQSYHPCCCMSHFFGMPTLKYKDQRGNITESPPLEYNTYQKEWIADITIHKLYSLLKCRGAGASEILTIRWRLYRSLVNHILDRKFCTIAGTHQALAIEFHHRIMALAGRRPFVYRDGHLPTAKNPQELRIGVSRFLALPADSEVIRGLENVEDVYLEEPASWNMQNDEPVIMAAEPHASKSGATIAVNGTPRGRRGFLWNDIWNPEIETNYHRATCHIDVVLASENPLLSRAEVEEVKLKKPRLYRQEFGLEFILPEDSLYGELTDDNISEEFKAMEL